MVSLSVLQGQPSLAVRSQFLKHRILCYSMNALQNSSFDAKDLLKTAYLLRIQISSVRFFVFKNAFISKQHEWTDQLKYCPSLSTTFSHPSGNFSNSISKKWLVFEGDPILEPIFDFCERSEPVTCCILRNNQ